MAVKDPGEIWEQSEREGERRLSRSLAGLMATGLVGGLDVMLGIVALTVTMGAMEVTMPEPTAHLIGSLTFGFGFAFLVIGRSELFTENFMVPISAAIRREAGGSALLRLWVGTLIGNLLGLALLSLILSRAGLVPPDALDAAGSVAETFAERSVGSALLSAIVAGAVMTLLTWLVHAAESDIARLWIALLIGFILAAPSLNHAVVSFGEMGFGLMAGTGDAEWADLAQNFPIAVAGNLFGGFAFVTVARFVQMRGEPV
ncbi:MAG TPA: formate/nitrite transporter family protein [Solirubrobacterales bacterium]|jgi:formate/nitrite transporter FocA (FNT family)|nr:formate/nitrite transporter family protein [Solirubrobacterales bacterium]